MADALTQMIDDLRKARPPVYDADRFASWGEALAQVIQALPRFEQRWASVALVSADVAREMTLPISMAFRSLSRMLLSHTDCEQVLLLHTPLEEAR